MKKFLNILLSLSVVFIMLVPSLVFADVGDFESYGSDFGSSWDSGYSDYGGGYSSGGYMPSFIYFGDGWYIYLIIIIIIYIIKSKKGNSNSGSVDRFYAQKRDNYIRSNVRSEAVANEIRTVDKYFNDEKFITWVKNLFVKLQTAWSERDWETIRPLESEALFEQHSRQLQGYIDRKQINKMERICVNFAELVSFAQDNEKDILVVALNSSMTDYIIDEVSGEVLKGDKDRRITTTYKLTFTRKNGRVTREGTDELETTNCPNCGAPTTITSSGKCEYCGSVITVGEHDWVLNDMERF